MTVYRDAALATSPVAYWRLGEASGVTAADEMGAYPGTYVNTPTLGVAGLLSGDADTSMTVTAASTQYARIVNAGLLPSTATATVVFWFNMPAQVAYAGLAFDANSQFVVYCANTGTTGLVGRLGGTGNLLLTTSVDLTGATHMLALTLTGGICTAYIDGAFNKATATTGGTTVVMTDLRFGMRTSFPLSGTLDEAAIWNRALSAAEIAELYRIGIGTAPVIITVGGLVTGFVPVESIVVKESGTRERGQLDCDVLDTGSTLTLSPKAQVRVYDANDGRYVFTGYLNPTSIALFGLGRQFHLTCVDLGEVLDTSLVVSDVRPAESFYDRITYLVSTYGPLLPQTFTYVEALGTVAAATYENMTLRTAIETTCSLIGTTADYFLDGAGLLHAGTTLLGAAPFKLRSSGTLGSGEIFPDALDMTRDPSQLVNAYWVRGKNAAGSGWVTDAASIAVYGRREAYFDAPDADTGAKRDAVGNAALADNSSSALQGTFTAVAADGFRPGQTLTVQYAPQFDIASPQTYRINTVERRYSAGGTLRTYACQFGGKMPLWSTSVPSPQSWPGSRIAAGSLSLTPFADTIRPVAIVGSLPSLPNALYPADSYVVLSTTHRLYKNVAGAWVLGVDGADIVADTITAGQIAVGAIGASEIAANAVTAVAIAAGTVSTDKLSVGVRASGAGNQVPNPSFEDVAATIPDGWALSPTAAGTPVTIATNTGTKQHGARCLTVAKAANTDGGGAISTSWPVTPGETYYVSVWAIPTVSTTNGLYVRCDFATAAGATDSSIDVVANAATTAAVWTQYQGYVTVPAGKTWMRLELLDWITNVNSSFFFDNVVVERAAGGVRNSDGNVTIDSSGITVTNGKITVTNAGSTVIIDGTSNMFKIAATGTLSVVSAASEANTSTTLTGLGTLSATPAHSCYLSDTSGNTGNRYNGFYLNEGVSETYVASTSGGSPTTGSRNIGVFGSMLTVLDGSGYCVVKLLAGDASGMGPTIYGKYYVMKEAAL